MSERRQGRGEPRYVHDSETGEALGEPQYPSIRDYAEVQHRTRPGTVPVLSAAEANDFLRLFALNNHSTLSTADLRNIEGVRTLLYDLTEAFGNFEWGSSDLQYMLEKLERIVKNG